MNEFFFMQTFFALVAISVSFLSKWFLTVLALIRHAILMDSNVIKHVTQLWKSQRAVVALQNLIHSFGLAVVPMDNFVIAFVHNFIVLEQVFILLNA